MDSIFKAFGLSVVKNPEVAQQLTDNFKKLENRGTSNGVFLGVDALNNLVAELQKGGFDGLMLSFGHSDKTPEGSFELVASQLKLKGGKSLDIIKTGQFYTSFQGPGVVSEPKVATCPPFKCS